MRFLLVLRLLVLLAAANGTPVIVKDILADWFAISIDGDAKFVDGRPILGSSETVRGVFLSILMTSEFVALVGLDWRIGALVANVAIAGDLSSGFLKHRMNLPPGSKATGLDQIPESLFPLFACRSALRLTALEIVAVTVIFFGR